MTKQYRPWGKLQWLLGKFPANLDWFFCGAISSEDRTLESYDVCSSLIKIFDSYFLEIKDKPSRFDKEIEKRIQKTKCSLKDKRILSKIREFSLFDFDLDSLVCDHFDKIVASNPSNIIIDISCLPKKFFFPLIKRAYLQRNAIQNLIVTQTIPDSYPNDKNDLAESPEPWQPLSPIFRGNDNSGNYQNIFVGVGHLPMGAPEQIRDICNSSNIHLLFPFPGSTSSFEPTWKFVHEIEKMVLRPGEKVQPNNVKIKHISAINTAELYDFFNNETDTGNDLSMFLPYGPKPSSLAMALFTCKHPQNPVYYTQPQVYRPDYSIGVKKENGESVITAYLVIANGNNLYW